ncbi:putative metallophosphoesterase At3g03305 [Telopea speciosissima]|uniref:putative metallophosphoesterase At3g03305 n=1 Tax=Telopea speciosissima TaxID=54955 RepID=UPI001CC3F23F|nr:putative metallophosphoesterase At3g03305 [Telopea speciosissima]
MAHEIFFYLNHVKGKTGYAAIKIDMSKAYDRVEWSLLTKLALFLGFNTEWTSIVHSLISSTSFSFKIDGGSFGYIKPHRGLRQGCPLSPYLFLFTMEVLSRLLTTYQELNLFHGIKVARNAPEIHRLLFADDTLIFCRATKEDFLTIKAILDLFSDLTGQEINFQKNETSKQSMNYSGKSKMEFLLLLLLFFSVPSTINCDSIQTHERIEGEKPNSRAIIDVKDGPDSVIWVVQLSDLHFSVFHPDRALDFERLVGPTLAMIKPSLVLITGDLTDGKSEDLLTMKQNEEEWIEYHKVMEKVVKRSGIEKNIFYDLRGNHDNFGVPVVGGSFDFFSKYSISGELRRNRTVNSVTIQSGGRKHLFVGFDSTMAIGLRGPTNLFGHPTEELLANIDTELSQWNSQSAEQVTKITFGHFPLSFSASTETGRSLKDVFLKNALSAYLCGHLHTKFGKNLKRHHLSGHRFLSLEKYFQLNIHQTPEGSTVGQQSCSNEALSLNEFWEWEMGDWRKNRVMRVLAIDSGHVSFVDIDFKMEAKKTIILPTFPLDSRFMLMASAPHDYGCFGDPSFYENVRALVFSVLPIVSVVARIYDSRSGHLDIVMESSMTKHENSTRGDLYTVPWNWRAFDDPSPDRFWLEIEATDILGRSTITELRPFSINGLTAKLNWKWTEFLVMGCQWAALYYPILWSILLFLSSILLVPKALLICSEKQYTYNNFIVEKSFISGVLWVLTDFCWVSVLWFGLLIYLFYLVFFPWGSGQVFTEGGGRGDITIKGWVVGVPHERGEQAYIGHPDVMVVVLPHLCFVVLPAVFVMCALVAERAIYRLYFFSLSGKKEDDYIYKSQRSSTGYLGTKGSKFLCGGRFVRKLLILFCLIVYWKHWKLCRALVEAYEMSPFLHFPGYCLPIPLLLAYAVYKTRGV